MSTVMEAKGSNNQHGDNSDNVDNEDNPDNVAGNYKVGFGRPPLHSQFPKGRSGNPSGRPKGSRVLSAVITAALAERAVVTENGRRRSITKLELAVKQIANKAAGGDQRACKLIIELLHQSEVRDEARASGMPLTADERRANDGAILAALRDRALSIDPSSAMLEAPDAAS